MIKTRLKLQLSVFFVFILMMFNQNSFAGGFYLPEVGSPGSVGTAGVANVVNNFGTDSALTNPAGMTGLKRDQVLVGNQALIPYQKFDSSVAEAGGDDGGNAGVLAVIPGFYAVKTLGDRFRAGFSVAGPVGGGGYAAGGAGGAAGGSGGAGTAGTTGVTEAHNG